jgi:hypothetical protein
MPSMKTITALSSCLVLMSLMRPAFAITDHVPNFDVKSSCKAAEAYDVMEDRDKTFQGCLQDENRAKSLLTKNWSQYKIKDRVDCVTQGEIVAPSYVEILTCLEMSDETGAALSRDVNQPTGSPDTSPIKEPPLPSAIPK